MVLDLFPVGAVLNIAVIQLTHCHSSGYGQRNPLVGRAEQHVKLLSEGSHNSPGIILAQTAKLSSCSIKSCIDKKRRLSSAFGDKIPEPQHLAVNHKLDEFLLVIFHPYPPCLCVKFPIEPPQSAPEYPALPALS